MGNCIVYVGKIDGKLMYVGEGNPNRWKHLLTGTSHVYEANRAHFLGITIDVEIIHSNLLKEEAKRIEKELIETLNPEWNKETVHIGGLETRRACLESARRAIKKEKVSLQNQKDFLFYVVRRMNRLSTCIVTQQDIKRDFSDKFTDAFLSNLCKGRAYDKLNRIIKTTYIKNGEYSIAWIYDLGSAKKNL